jgi:acyl-CoA reductase-like NAD-dependent aldehyde dehydrogenase
MTGALLLIDQLSLAAVDCQVEVDKAVEAARQAFDIRSPWRRLEPAARGQLMRTFASLLRRDLDYLSVSFLRLRPTFEFSL